MEKSISIVTELEDGDAISIPVAYSVKHEDENSNITLISCTVKLEEDKMPEWLSPTSFMIRQVYSPGNPGVTVTELSSIICKNIDSAKFVDRMHAGICLAEKLKS